METQNNNNSSSSSSNWWKWLLGVATLGGAWYLLSGFKTPELPPVVVPDGDPPLDENFEITLWKDFIMSTGNDNYPNAVMANAVSNGSGNLETLFKGELQHTADLRFISDGLTEGTYRSNAMKAIQVRIMAIKRVPAWVEAIQAQAAERGISYEAALQLNAIWGILEEKIAAYLVRYRNSAAYQHQQQQQGQSGVYGTAII